MAVVFTQMTGPAEELVGRKDWSCVLTVLNGDGGLTRHEPGILGDRNWNGVWGAISR